MAAPGAEEARGAVETVEACAVCGKCDGRRLFAARDRHYGLPGEFWIVRCAGCGLLRTSPRPSGAALAAFYPGDYAPHAESGQSTAPRRRGPAPWRWLRQHGLNRRIWWLPELPPGSPVLELGSGAGHFVAEMLARGWNVHALEPVLHAVARIARDRRVHVHAEPAEKLTAADGTFDAVFAWMVVEHLADPAAVLRRVAAVLRPGGYFVCSIPNAGSWEFRVFKTYWYSLDVPRHLSHFTRHALTMLLASSGLRVERVFHQKTLRDVSGSLALLAADRPRLAPLARAAGRLLDRASVSLGAGTLLAALRQGGRVTVVARKPAP